LRLWLLPFDDTFASGIAAQNAMLTTLSILLRTKVKTPEAAKADVVVLAVGDVGFSQQKIRRHVEQPCNLQHLLMGQGSFCATRRAYLPHIAVF